MTKTKKLLVLSLMISISLVLYYIESILPTVHFIAPGVKLGLSNIIVLICLVGFGFKDTFIVFLLKTILSSFFATGMSSFLYSFVGGVFSLVSMYLLLYKVHIQFSLVGISVAGSFFYNFGQLLTSSLVLQNIKIFYYLPVVSLFSVGTGIFVGLVSIFFIENTKKLIFMERSIEYER